MPFLDPDSTEISTNKLAENMNADELMQYFVASQKRVNGLEVTVRPIVDHLIFDRLIEDYPQPRAGWVVKWLFYRHKGKAEWDRSKQVVRIPQLSRSWRWLVEQWWTQVQMDAKREERKFAAAEPASFATIADL